MLPNRDDRPGAWGVYRGTGEPHDGIDALPDPPAWRTFNGGPPVSLTFGEDPEMQRRLGPAGNRAYRPDDHVIDLTNTALYLRKPLLVTGSPGTGKSTLAYSIAAELKLGPVLHWPVTSRSTLADALYRYDAIGRLQEASLRRSPPDPPGNDAAGDTPIGRYIRLGPLGSALLPAQRPRVVLIDEIDKSDIDLPNDLLHVLDTGEFVIPELARLPADQADVEVMVADSNDSVSVRAGLVRCRAFPVVVITSNGERALPPAFLRRCVRLRIEQPGRDQLVSIIEAQLGPGVLAESYPLIERFVELRANAELAIDQLLNAIYLATSSTALPEATHDRVSEALFTDLASPS
jgi:MoxR-like ATPase